MFHIKYKLNVFALHSTHANCELCFFFFSRAQIHQIYCLSVAYRNNNKNSLFTSYGHWEMSKENAKLKYIRKSVNGTTRSTAWSHSFFLTCTKSITYRSRWKQSMVIGLVCHHTGKQKVAFCTTWLSGFISHFISDPGRKTSWMSTPLDQEENQVMHIHMLLATD